MKTTITLTKIDKYYPHFSFKKPFTKQKTYALKDISATINSNQTVGILGPNGAGKTTLLKLIATIILADKGHIAIQGLTPGKDDQLIKSRIGYVGSSERSFYWRLNGLQNLEFYASLYGIPYTQTKKRIAKLAALFNVHFLKMPFGLYSSGMKRICALIRALLHEPQILLLDEPTKSLDHNTKVAFLNYIKNLKNKGKIILYVSHDIKQAHNLCDSFLILKAGELKEKVTDTTCDLPQLYERTVSDV